MCNSLYKPLDLARRIEDTSVTGSATKERIMALHIVSCLTVENKFYIIDEYRDEIIFAGTYEACVTILEELQHAAN